VETRDIVTDGCGRPDASATFVMLFNILHIEDPVSLLREAHRVLRAGGTGAFARDPPASGAVPSVGREGRTTLAQLTAATQFSLALGNGVGALRVWTRGWLPHLATLRGRG
jgi:hypothetical protein